MHSARSWAAPSSILHSPLSILRASLPFVALCCAAALLVALLGAITLAPYAAPSAAYYTTPIFL
ncbi:MAG: hypothetical protein KBS42_06940, partial [Bacteroidales bacterium]|nr:hypothetical protein [Candidatus Colicola coprequi]